MTWIIGSQAWHMYSSCSVHWVMQAEMPPSRRNPPPSPLLSPPVNRHRRGQERPDLFRGRHHNKKGGPERHRLHFPGIQRPDVGSTSDVWQQHGHQSGDLHGAVRRSLILYMRSHGARWRAGFWPHPRSPDSPFDMRACISTFIFTSCYPLLSSHE